MIKSKEVEVIPCYVYFLVETNFFKIGVSKKVIQRIKNVSFNMCMERSFCLSFNAEADAYSCEKLLHWLFRKDRRSLIRQGGTEFFKINCFEKAIKFIEEFSENLCFDEKILVKELLNKKIEEDISIKQNMKIRKNVSLNLKKPIQDKFDTKEVNFAEEKYCAENLEKIIGHIKRGLVKSLSRDYLCAIYSCGSSSAEKIRDHAIKNKLASRNRKNGRVEIKKSLSKDTSV